MSKTEENPLHSLDKSQYRDAFNRAASRYDEVAVLQKEVGQRLLERLEYMRIEPQVIVDVGAGTGLCSLPLNKRYKKSQVIALDIAPAMLVQARKKLGWLEKTFSNKLGFVCGDADTLPLQDQSVDMIFSNLTLQWCGDLEQTFSEFRRVLKSNGLLMFTTLGPDTLKELRHSWQAVDTNVHVHDFTDMHDVGDALVRAKLADPVMDMETITMTYKETRTLLQDLKTLGAHNAAHSRSKGLTGKKQLKTMLDAYEHFRNDGVLPATYEVIYGHAWSTDMNRRNKTEVNVQLQTK